jgi:hypothetical protein
LDKESPPSENYFRTLTYKGFPRDEASPILGRAIPFLQAIKIQPDTETRLRLKKISGSVEPLLIYLKFKKFGGAGSKLISN